MNENALRAQTAYQAYQGGFPATVPHWDLAPSWVRDIAVACYLQGKLDALSAALAHKPVGPGIDDIMQTMCCSKPCAAATATCIKGYFRSKAARVLALMSRDNITIRASK